ncbi:hypothetical protein COU77_01840, partial [Candidatus Peregrinibacteria bacterium CG10_big_fil_rev_8_21_14_0_10_49_16]
MGLTPQVVEVLATLILALHIIIPILILALLFESRKKKTPVSQWFSRHGLLLMFIVALVATSMSLFFSEIALFQPCRLCWMQRIFMYPQVILLGGALYWKERTIAKYILLLSLIGIAISALHYGEQVQAMLYPEQFDPLTPCDLSGISCRATYVLEYGYITI